ncbi:DUF2066 domain-containing protein [Legionella impletisoli]|uniref:Uncharacterized protein n=1 Tax=Legionella impletisoli TaxID=343510 RepID=A0A917JVH4_9GAMM|nr:DUF2066 domain-containing protein [Legionella impletisoli]GGI84320.1 hypothetical protein GCM10007966_11250 [Legionella impletisoli]
MPLILFWITLTFSTLSVAAPSWIYEIQFTHPINNKAMAFHQALQQVVDRLTPGPNDHENPIINASNPKDYIETIHIKTNTLTLRFNPKAIHALMNQAGQQPWLENRPKIKTWVCRAIKSELNCLDAKKDLDVFSALTKAAKEKGLELEFQSTHHLDKLRTTNNSTLSDLESFIMLFKNQKPETVLLIKLYRSHLEEETLEDWRIFYQGTYSPYMTQPLSRLPKNVGKKSLAEISHYLFAQGEEVAKPMHAVDIRISNIQTAKAYKKVSHYLKQIPGVKHTRLNSVTEDAVLYTLDITIPTELLEMRLAQKYASLPSLDGEEEIINFRLKT